MPIATSDLISEELRDARSGPALCLESMLLLLRGLPQAARWGRCASWAWDLVRQAAGGGRQQRRHLCACLAERDHQNG